jgi:hypothetical protein
MFNEIEELIDELIETIGKIRQKIERQMPVLLKNRKY